MNELKKKIVDEMTDDEFKAFDMTDLESLYYNISSPLSRGYFSMSDYRVQASNLIEYFDLVPNYDKNAIRYESIWNYEEETDDFKKKVDRVFDEIFQEVKNQCRYYFSELWEKRVEKDIKNGKINGIDLEIVKEDGAVRYGMGIAHSQWLNGFYSNPNDILRRLYFLVSVNGMDYLDLLVNEAKIDYMKQKLVYYDEEAWPFDPMTYIDLCKENISLHDKMMVEPQRDMKWNDTLLEFFKNNKKKMFSFLDNIREHKDKDIAKKVKYCYNNDLITIYKGCKSDGMSVKDLYTCLKELGYLQVEYNTFNSYLDIK